EMFFPDENMLRVDPIGTHTAKRKQATGGEVKTFNLATGEAGPVFVGLSPEDAVRAANAQSRGDFNTWDYGKYELVENELTVRSGDFTAFKFPGMAMGRKFAQSPQSGHGESDLEEVEVDD